ncbi:MAG TPA: DNA-processing protein DprA, partial [Nitrospiria bacterium]|nr:DNA-processing protein DprA [Nitrospiria bacterium]
MNREELFGWLALKAVPGLGDVLYKRLIEKFGSPHAVFAAPESELLSVEGLRLPIAQAIRTGTAAEAVSKELDGLEKNGVEIVTILDEDYPELLRQIHDPPPFLYVRGELLPEDQKALAIVGSRQCSEYGRAVSRRMGQELARRGFTIVSGLARGIDGAAHEGALSVGGRTLGVLGCGVDVAYPLEHLSLKEAISKQGAVISEFPLATAPVPENFPRRNRVISGLCLGVIVVEAADQSGALITATSALEQGREVFAVPGPIGSKTSVGTHRLIKQGAKLIEGVEDILEEISGQLQPSGPSRSVSTVSAGPPDRQAGPPRWSGLNP